MPRVLVLGGYGVFGSRAAERLLRDSSIEVVIAGRSKTQAALATERFATELKHRISSAQLDATLLSADDLRRLGVSVVINTVGPYQAQNYRVAEAAIAAGVHYVDLADARAFVTGIRALDAAAKRAGVLVVSGASTVPALAASVIDDLLPRFKSIDALTYGISPGNSFDPGAATVQSIIAAVGQPFTTLVDGRMQTVHGWQSLTRHRFADKALGTRILGACDVPDLDLFPARYPTLRTQRFVAGVEVKAFHLGLYALSWLVRFGLVRNAGRLGRPLMRAKQQLGFLGSDRGAMFVELAGTDAITGAPLTITWELAAYQSHGPYVPATPAVILTKRLTAGALATHGAMPCLGLMTRADFFAEIADLDIRQTVL